MKKILAAALMMSCVSACKKDKNVSADVYTLKGLFATVAPTERVITIDAGVGASFSSAGTGVRYIIPANAFQNSSGALVSGSVQIYVSEYLKKSDMLFSGIMPISNGEPLLSGGEVKVMAKQNGQPLWLTAGKSIRTNIPQGGTPMEGMMLFMGQEDPITNNINWTIKADSAQARGGIVYNSDTLGLVSDSMGLCNADRFMSSPDYQSFNVTASTADGTALTDELSGYALYDNYNGLWQMHPTNKQFNEGHVPNIPVHFVVVCIIDGNLYTGILGATPANGTNYNVVLSKTTVEAFKAKVEAL